MVSAMNGNNLPAAGCGNPSQQLGRCPSGAAVNAPDTPQFTRREALKIIGTGVAVAGLGLTKVGAAEATAVPALGWELPPLGYAYGALEPHFDARTMEIHHTKHHQAYINNAKNLLKDHPDLLARGPEALVRDLASVPEAIRTGIRNNAGGHVNHAFFWQVISPATGMSIQQLPVAIAAAFGSMDDFKKLFADAAMKRFGSGWAWLSLKDGKLIVHSTANQDSPLSDGAKPIIGLDVWEHAYYLHYQNRRADYVNAFWNVLNWTQAEANYGAALKG
jgi:Fe-Mn family superoxide dismutase